MPLDVLLERYISHLSTAYADGYGKNATIRVKKNLESSTNSWTIGWIDYFEA